jgi:hypothetical protein
MTHDQKAQGRNHCDTLFTQDSFPDVQDLHEALLILEAEVSSLHFLATLRERWWHADGAVPSLLSQEA